MIRRPGCVWDLGLLPATTLHKWSTKRQCLILFLSYYGNMLVVSELACPRRTDEMDDRTEFFRPREIVDGRVNGSGLRRNKAVYDWSMHSFSWSVAIKCSVWPKGLSYCWHITGNELVYSVQGLLDEQHLIKDHRLIRRKIKAELTWGVDSLGRLRRHSFNSRRAGRFSLTRTRHLSD